MKVATSVGRYVNERAAPIYDELKKFLRGNSPNQREATVQALKAAVEIANRTFQYFATQRRTGERDFHQERSLSEGWSEVGLQLARLDNPPTELVERYLIKSQYWSSPDDWTEERIVASRIGLEQIANESRLLLLGRSKNTA